MNSYIFFFNDRTGLVVVASTLTEAISKVSTDKLCQVVKIEVPPFEVL